MPSPGLQIFGSGMRLQAVSPGVQDQGNFNASGIGIMGFSINGRGNKPAMAWTAYRSSIVGENHTFNVGAGADKLFQVTVIGNYCVIGPTGNPSITRDGIAIGYSASIGWAQCIAIGRNAQAGHPTSTVSNVDASIAIGDSTTCYMDPAAPGNGRPLAIGVGSAYTNIAQAGLIGIGPLNNAAAPGFCTVVAPFTTVNAQNVIYLGNGSPGPISLATPNQIRIGDSSQTSILIGGKDFSNGTAASARLIADAAATVTAQDSALIYSSITAARVVTLPAANSVAAGFRILVSDASGAASAINTITLTRAGADTINGAATTAIATAYGCRELISDGVSKWTVIRSM